MKLRTQKQIKRRSRYEVWASGGGIQGATYHRKISKAKGSKRTITRKVGGGVVLYDLNKDKPL